MMHKLSRQRIQMQMERSLMCRWIVQFLAIRKTAAASWTFSSGAYILQTPTASL